MEMKVEQTAINSEYLRLALLEALAAHQNRTPSITAFTNTVAGALPMGVRARINFPHTPHDRWRWLVQQADSAISTPEVETIRYYGPSIQMQRKGRHVEITPLADPGAERAAEHDPVALAVTEAEAVASAAYTRTPYQHDREWMPRPDSREHSGEALGPKERIVNMRVYYDGWITHAIDLGQSPMIEHETFVNIQIRIKHALGIGDRPARVPRENGRGGYWVVPPDVLSEIGLGEIQARIREAYALYGYKVYFTTMWKPSPFADVDLVR